MSTQLVELLVKVGDSASGQWRDGMVIEWRPLGAHATPEEARLWLETGEPPEVIRKAIFGEALAQHVRHVERMRCLLDPELDVPLAAKIAGTDEATIREWVATAELGRGMLLADGYDTNWGHADLRKHAAVIAELSPAWVSELVSYPTLRDGHPLAPRAVSGRKRGRRIAYEERLHDDTLVAVRDPRLLVVPPRDATPATASLVRTA